METIYLVYCLLQLILGDFGIFIANKKVNTSCGNTSKEGSRTPCSFGTNTFIDLDMSLLFVCLSGWVIGAHDKIFFNFLKYFLNVFKKCILIFYILLHLFLIIPLLT